MHMELYIGGFAQGKLEYVLKNRQERKKTAETVIDCAQPGYREKIKEAQSCDVIINHLHLWVKDLLAEGKQAGQEILAYAQAKPDAVFICDEIGNGIVPLEKEDRIWREETGRLLVSLASKAERVERILCGLGQRLK